MKIEIIEFFDGNKLLLGKKIEEKENKVTVEKASKQKVKLTNSRVLFRHEFPEKESLSITFSQIENEIYSLQTAINIDDLWELSLLEEREFSINELAELIESNPSSLLQSAVFRLIRSDNLHFKRKNLTAIPRTKEQIHEIKVQLKKEEEKKRIHSYFYNNLVRAMRSEEVQDEEFFDHLSSWLKNQDNSILTAIIEKLANGQDSRVFIYNVLLNNGKVKEDSDKFALIYGIETDFNDTLIESANNLVINLADRYDYTDVFTVTIDSEETKEIDDALSLDIQDDSVILGVHIIDLGSFVAKGTLLDKEALERISTIYLETGEITMFPEAISYDKLSLIKDKVRPAMSTFFTFDKDYNIIKKDVKLTNIKVDEKISYNEVEKIFRGKGQEKYVNEFKIFKQIAERLRNKRFKNGGFDVLKPELELRASKGVVSLKVYPRRSKSRQMVAEMMILMNSYLAAYAASNKIPLIFKSQEAPDADYIHFINNNYYDPVMTDKLLKHVHPSHTSLFPGRHHSLGVFNYTQVTSPIRRYSDLIHQRQIIAFIKGEKLPYSKEELLGLITYFENKNSSLREMYKKSFNYWFYKYIEDNLMYEPLEAVVVNETEKSYVCELLKYGKRYSIKSKEMFDIGDIVTIMVDKVDPNKETIKFSVLND